jgi:hypothetical protein
MAGWTSVTKSILTTDVADRRWRAEEAAEDRPEQQFGGGSDCGYELYEGIQKNTTPCRLYGTQSADRRNTVRMDWLFVRVVTSRNRRCATISAYVVGICIEHMECSGNETKARGCQIRNKTWED